MLPRPVRPSLVRRCHLLAVIVMPGPCRKREPAHDEPHHQSRDDPDRGAVAQGEARDEQQRAGHGRQQQYDADDGEPRGPEDRLRLDMASGDEPVEGHRSDEGACCGGAEKGGHHINGVVGGGERGESGGEDHGEEKSEENLHAGPGDPDLLEEFAPSPVRPLLLGFVASVCRPLPVRFHATSPASVQPSTVTSSCSGEAPSAVTVKVAVPAASPATRGGVCAYPWASVRTVTTDSSPSKSTC